MILTQQTSAWVVYQYTLAYYGKFLDKNGGVRNDWIKYRLHC